MLARRQVHLDFHTNGTLEVGTRFSKEQFQAALQKGHINSVTVFSKCHHGWSYHPTKANRMHPGLQFDLLGAQLEACREIGVRAPVYISAGCDEKDYEQHPEWRLVTSPDPASFERYKREVHFHLLCLNTPYLDVLCAQIEEVMQLYNPCGIFLDIVGERVCYCDKCRADMQKAGLSVEDEKDRRAFAKTVFHNYIARANAAVRKYSDTATVFHNSGHVPKGDYGYINGNTHLELESLPTGGWGYDHFPLSAAYARSLQNVEFLGMTGKFHHSWGEFGGYKHPNALLYETALSVANGAGCSVGDQMHPLGEMNEATYALIGKAYAQVEEKEPWLDGAVNIADIAVLSAEALTGGADRKADVGANRMLLESKCLYDFIDTTADFSDYKVLILPDAGGFDTQTTEKIKAYAANGGKVIASGDALLSQDGFFLDIGAKYRGMNAFNPTYLVPQYPTVNGDTQYVMRCRSWLFDCDGCETVALAQNPYFNRTAEHFCSHMHAPNDPQTSYPAAVIKGNVAYIGWDLFTAYAQHGHLCFRELFEHILFTLAKEELSVRAELPDRAVVTLTRQQDKNRSILHLLFAHTTVRGTNTEVIEDTVPLYNVNCSVRSSKKPACVCLAPQGTPLDFTYENGRVRFTVPEVNIHQMIVLADGT